MYYGYNRVSTKTQHLDRGNINIENYCREHNYPLVKIFVDTQTGRNYARPRYTVMKEDVLRAGDVIVIPEYDRLGRADETKKELEYYKEHGVRVIFLDIPTTQIDLSDIPDEMAKMILSYINNMLIEFYDLLARTELEQKKKRQMEGIEAMKKRGEWDRYGRPRIKKPESWDEVIAIWNSGQITAVEAMKRLNMKKTMFYKFLKEEKRGSAGNGSD